jgi:hypothetical protein
LKNDELLHCQSEIPGEDEREAWSLFLEQRFAGEDVFIKLILSDNRLIKLNRAYHWKFVEFKHVHLGDKLDTLGYPFVHLTLTELEYWRIIVYELGRSDEFRELYQESDPAQAAQAGEKLIISSHGKS